MHFNSERSERGVSERGFVLTVAGEQVPGILWTAPDAPATRPLVLIGHGGTQHKRVENVLALARRLVRHLGYAAVAIDAPGHGERTTPEQATRAREALQARMATGSREAMPPGAQEEMAARAARAVPEWRATLDTLQQGGVAGLGPIGYWGVSMGTANGVPLLAAEPRIQAAVLGLAGLRFGGTAFEQAARSITIPLLFVFQWHDELVARDAGLALSDAFAAKDKSMHINPGGHTAIPAHERESFERFYLRHLGPADS